MIFRRAVESEEMKPQWWCVDEIPFKKCGPMTLIGCIIFKRKKIQREFLLENLTLS
jgi:hypothetical protein